MPRQRNHYPRAARALPEDFPQRLERFKEVSGLSWRELAPTAAYLSRHALALAEGGQAPPAASQGPA